MWAPSKRRQSAELPSGIKDFLRGAQWFFYCSFLTAMFVFLPFFLLLFGLDHSLYGKSIVRDVISIPYWPFLCFPIAPVSPFPFTPPPLIRFFAAISGIPTSHYFTTRDKDGCPRFCLHFLSHSPRYATRICNDLASTHPPF